MKENNNEIAQCATEKPNDLAHPHSGREENPENNATSPAPAVSGAVPCSALVQSHGLEFAMEESKKRMSRVKEIMSEVSNIETHLKVKQEELRKAVSAI